MREIKFRAWDHAFKLMEGPGDLYWIQREVRPLLIEYGGGDLTFMQYTGLKDKNGVEIYEGDILQHPEGREVFEVKWEAGHTGFRACYAFSSGLLPLQVSESGGRATVIGNIHESPELLK